MISIIHYFHSVFCYTFLAPSSNSTATVSGLYIKLDFTKFTYNEKYKDGSSREFKEMANDIKSQVKAAVSFSLSYAHGEKKYT